VNTAARLQSVAPVGSVAVGEQTHRTTSALFEYELLEPVSVKGKSGPLALWRAHAARSRFGTDITRAHTTPLVGRELEKSLLIGTLERAAQQRSVQLVTVIGEPGVGKSRLVGELFGYADSKPELTRWRQGRCLPYGEGITFWALGEIVKAEAGILESDSAEVAAAKLDSAVAQEESERQWLLQRLAPLVGAQALQTPSGGNGTLLTGIDDVAGVAPVDSAEHGDPITSAWQVSTAAGTSRAVRIRRDDGPMLPSSCGADPEPQARYDLLDFQTA